jgi:ribonuclease BN (tRNA processing enzyme)
MSSNSRITTLGTVSDINAMQDHRTSSGILVEVDDNMFLIDPGIGTIVRLSQINVQLSSLNAILISNNDIIYSNDVNAVIEHSNKSLHLIGPNDFLKHEESVLTKKHSTNLKIINADEDKRTIIRGDEIEAYANKNNSVSYKITSNKFILGYISKAKYSKSFVQKFQDSNILIINLHNINDKDSDYLDVEEIIEIIKEINPELVILNGYSRKVLENDPLDISRKMKLEIQKIKSEGKDSKPLKTQIHIAKELMIINPESYNIKLKQKKLKGFF